MVAVQLELHRLAVVWLKSSQVADFLQAYLQVGCYFWLCSYRVTENESVNKMSLHNLATVFGPTLLRPSEKDSKISNSSQPISMNDSWSLEVMAQVKPASRTRDKRYLYYLCGSDRLPCVSVGASPSLLPAAGEHSNAWQQTSKPSLLYWSITANVMHWSHHKCSVQRAES